MGDLFKQKANIKNIRIYTEINNEDIMKIIDFVNNFRSKNIFNNMNFNEFIFIGRGTFGLVYSYKNYAIKMFYGLIEDEICRDEDILSKLQGISSYPKLFLGHNNFIVTELIKGKTLFDCDRDTDFLSVNEQYFQVFTKDIEKTLKLKIRPYDLHTQNIILNEDGLFKIIDVGNFRRIKRNPLRSFNPFNRISDFEKKWYIESNFLYHLRFCIRNINYYIEQKYESKKVV